MTLDGIDRLPTTTWNDTADRRHRARRHPGRAAPAGDHGRTTASSTVNGLTFHVLGGISRPGTTRPCARSAPGKTYATIQAALDAAFTSAGDDLVVVYPGTPTWPTRGTTRAAPTTRT